MLPLPSDQAPAELDQGPPAIYTPAQLLTLRRVLARTGYYVVQGSQLRITINSGSSGATVVVALRSSTLDGVISWTTYENTPAADGVNHVFTATLGEQLLFNVAAYITGTNTPVGLVFVEVDLAQGSIGPTANIYSVLLQGFPSTTSGIAWPGSPFISSLETGGSFRTIVGTDQGVGNAISETVPTGTWWRLLALTIATNAGAGTTCPSLSIADAGGHLIAQCFPLVTQWSVANGKIVWMPGYAATPTFVATAIGQVVPASMPYPLTLGPGFTIKVASVGGVDLGAPIYQVQQRVFLQ